MQVHVAWRKNGNGKYIFKINGMNIATKKALNRVDWERSRGADNGLAPSHKEPWLKPLWIQLYKNIWHYSAWMGFLWIVIFSLTLVAFLRAWLTKSIDIHYSWRSFPNGYYVSLTGTNVIWENVYWRPNVSPIAHAIKIIRWWARELMYSWAS